MRLFFALILVTALYSCKDNEGCTQFGSENYDPDAIVDDGSCVHIRDKFIGTFNVTSDCTSDQYEALITETPEDYVVTITNLADSLSSVQARVYADNITIDRQSIGIGVTIEGAGIYVEEAAISLSYRIRDTRSGTEVITDCLEWCSKIE
ncbi:MAG: hypothetical protein H6602_13140 [Flavobacteriales bacterium]|nr:hypothetical protein [Flavobacteriales bacterium]MCB9192601.1 hypothetical protein [Flavobacteriales bacterium]